MTSESRSACLAVLLGISFVTGPAALAGEIPVAVVKTARFNDLLKEMIPVKLVVLYSEEQKTIRLYFDDLLYRTAVLLAEPARGELKGLLDKYADWNARATEKGDKLEKEIGRFDTSGSWKTAGGWVFDKTVGCRVHFFSRSATQHQCVLTFDGAGKWASTRNPKMTHLPKALYLNQPDALALNQALSPEAVTAAIAEAAKKKSVEEEYK